MFDFGNFGDMFNGMFKPVGKDCCKLAINGDIAIKTSTGYKTFIGANYGDEGKGLMTRNFALDAKKKGKKPIVIFHNGTAQRGHTVDYLPDFRHIYHHFGSATAEKVPTFFADSFFIHPHGIS